jgi:hypothetical protein
LTISIPLSDERLLKLKELASAANVAPEELLRLNVEEWLSRPREDFARATKRVLEKNAELQSRLAGANVDC